MKAKCKCEDAPKMAKGGTVKSIKDLVKPLKGAPMSPITKVKMQNGIPGYKKGGSAKDCGRK